MTEASSLTEASARITSRESARSAVHSARPLFVTFLVVGALFATGSELAWSIFGAGNIGMAFFPPAGVTLAAMVLLPRHRWPAIVAAIWVGELVIDAQHGLPLGVAAGYALANTVEPLVGAFVLTRLAGRTVDLNRRSHMVKFLLAAVVAGPAAGAVIGGATKVFHSGGSWPRAALHFWAGDGLGVLAVGAPILVLRKAFESRAWSRKPETVAIIAVAVIVSVLGFWIWEVPPSILVLPVLVWVALRFATEGVAVVSLIVAIVANIATAAGRGPFAALKQLPAADRLAITQGFLATMILTAWFLAVATAERSDAITQREQERSARERAESTQAIGTLTAALVTSQTAEQIAGVIDRHARRYFNASRATLHVVPETNDKSHLVNVVITGEGERISTDNQAAVMSRPTYLSADGHFPIPDAIREKRTVLLPSMEEVATRYPELQTAFDDARIGALVVVPLPAELIVAGAVSIVFDSAQSFDAEQIARISTVVDTAGPALDRAALFARQQRRRASTEATSRLTAALAAAGSIEEVRNSAINFLPDLVAPAELTLVSRSIADSELRLLSSNVPSSPNAPQRHRLGTAHRLALLDAIDTAETVVLKGPAEYLARYPETLAQDWEGWGVLVGIPLCWAGNSFGGFALTLALGSSFNPDQLRLLRLIGDIVAQSLGRAHAFQEQQIRRRLAEVLHQCTTQLTKTELTKDDTQDLESWILEAVVTQSLSVFDANAGILVAVETDNFPVLCSQGFSAEFVATCTTLPRFDLSPLADAALRQSVVAIESEEAWSERYPGFTHPGLTDNITATLAVSMTTKRSEEMIVLLLSFRDATKLAEVAAILPSATQRWADLLDQSRLVMREREAQARLKTLQLLSAGLATARTEIDVVDVVKKQAPNAFDTFDIWLGLLDPASDSLRLVTSSEHTSPLEHFRSASLDERRPSATAMLERRPIYIESAEQLQTRYPESAAATIGIEALASIPLIVHGEAIGVLGITYTTPHRFDEPERRLHETFTDLCAQAIERIRLSDFEHDAAKELQHAMLGTPDTVTGVVTGFAYRPAESKMEVGGDWYDIIALRDGLIGLVIGDVVGHNVTAAATMGQLRSAIRALAPLLEDPAELVTQLETFIVGLDQARSTTLAYAIFDPANSVVRYHCAGHLPPLVVSPHGAYFLNEGRGTPIGTGLPRATASSVLPRSAALVLYTDGLVERRNESIDVGLERLVAAAIEREHLEPSSLCHALVAVMVSESEPRDDIAVVAIRTDSTATV